MFRYLFDSDLQEEMESFFLNELAPMGIERNYHEGTLLDQSSADHIGIVVSGRVSQIVYCEDGQRSVLWALKPGTIFGEMDFFEGQRTVLSTKISEESKIAYVSREKLQVLLEDKPHVYKYFMHSIIRKQRVLMLNYTNYRFNDVRGRIAGKILRMAFLKYKDELFDGMEIKAFRSHDVFSKSVGCSRSTLTSILKEFENDGLISQKRKKIRVLDVQGLESKVKRIW